MPSDNPDRDYPLTCRACKQLIPPGERAWFVNDEDDTGLHDACDAALRVGTR